MAPQNQEEEDEFIVSDYEEEEEDLTEKETVEQLSTGEVVAIVVCSIIGVGLLSFGSMKLIERFLPNTQLDEIIKANTMEEKQMVRQPSVKEIVSP